MSIMYITEFNDVGAQDPTSAMEPDNGDQAITFTATPGQSATFKSNTRMVRIQVDGIASIAFGTNPTATTSNRRMTAGQTEKYLIMPGSNLKVSAITNT